MDWQPMDIFPRDGRAFVAITLRNDEFYVRGVRWDREDELLYTLDGRGSYEWNFFQKWIDGPN